MYRDAMEYMRYDLVSGIERLHTVTLVCHVALSHSHLWVSFRERGR